MTPVIDSHYGIEVGDTLNESLSENNLEKLANDIMDWYSSDMGTWFDEIQGNEENIYNDILSTLESKDQEQIKHIINDIEDADLDDETAKKINIATTSSLVNRLKQLLNNNKIKTENKSKFYTAERAFDDFINNIQEESEDGSYTFKISDIGLSKEDSAEFKNLLLQRDEIDNIEYEPQNNTYTVKIKNVDNVEKSVDDKSKKETDELTEVD